MLRRPSWRICTVAGCPEYTRGGKCDEHRRQVEQQRGTARQRGYGGRQWEAARRAVLERDPHCVCTDPNHGHATPCGAFSNVADHHPDERRHLIEAGISDPDALHRLRGICSRCHARKGAVETPGGWARRDNA